MKTSAPVLVTLLFLALGAASIQGANKYWDIDGTTPGAGGATPSGNWNAAGIANWSTDSTGASAATTFANNDVAVFSAGTDASGAFTVTLTSAILANGVTVEEGTLLITGVAANTLNPGTTAGLIMDIASGLTTTFGTKMSATQGNPYKKRGAGTAVLTGANTFASPLQIEGGTVSVATINAANAAGPLGQGIGADKEVSLGTTIGGTGTLKYTGGTVTANSNRRFTIKATGTGVFQIDGAAVAVTIPGTLGGADGKLKKTGAGTLKPTNIGNSYSDVTVSEGTFQVSVVANAGIASPMGQGTTVTIEGGSAFSFTGTSASMDRAFVMGTGGGNIESLASGSVLTLTGGVTCNPANQPLAITGAGSVTISTTALNLGTGSLTMNGTGVLSLSAANTYGSTTINGGVVEGAASGSLGAGNVTVGSSGGLKLSHVSAMGSGANLLLASGVPANAANLNFTGTQTINGLSFNGGTTYAAYGTWGAPGSGAAHTDTRFTGTGILNLTTGGFTTTTALTSSISPSTYGAPVTFTATVSSGSGTPTGTVLFKDGAASIGTGSLNGVGQATLITSALSASGSPHSITASYSGDNGFNPSVSTSYPQGVDIKTVVPSVTVGNKPYDGNIAATITGRSLAGVVGTDDVSLGTSGTAAFADPSLGVGKSVGVSGLALSGSTAGNYVLSTTTLSTSADITAKALTITGLSVSDKPYDRTTTATLAGSPVLSGVVGTEDVSLTGTAATAFPSAAAGTYNLSVTGLSLTGADVGNYTLTPLVLSATIQAVQLTVQGIEASDKVYDGTTNATLILTNALLVGVLSPDDVILATNGATGAFTNKTVGVGKQVDVSGCEISGADAANYALVQPSTNASITVRSLTASATGVNKPYDNSTTATVTLSSDKVAGDDVTAAYTSAAFDTKNVGTGKPVAVSGISVAGGTDAANYSLANTAANTVADISAIALSVTGVTANNKPYDGNNIAALGGTAALSAGVVGGEDVSLGGTPSALFNNKNAGAAKPVTVTGYTLTGADIGNYTLAQPAGLTADIAAVGLTVTGVTANNKPYDGNSTATLGGTAALSAGVVGLEDVHLGGTPTAAFNNKNVGTAKPVTVAGYTLTGADIGNYTIAQPAGLTANITQAGLTVTGLAAQDKAYDGNTDATITGTGTLVGVISPDVVNLDGTPAGHFDTAAVGTGKTVSVTGLSLSGADALQYSLTPPTLTANITNSVIYSLANTLLSIVDIGGGSYTLYFQGTEGAKYYVVTSSDAAAAMNTWTVVGVTNTAGAGGLWNATVSGAAPAFYRGAAVDPMP